jgi:hypothetical protein
MHAMKINTSRMSQKCSQSKGMDMEMPGIKHMLVDNLVRHSVVTEMSFVDKVKDAGLAKGMIMIMVND